MAVTTAPAPLYGLRIGQVIHFDPMYAGTRVTAKMLRRVGATVSPLLSLYETNVEDRASRVIPNKVFDYLACARPVVTADTWAAREALVHADTAWLCPPGNPEALAESIAYLKCRPAVRRTMAVAGHAPCRREFSLDALRQRS